MAEKTFRQLILAYWRKNGRHDLPWRQTADPYAVLVSEMMLQQTQVSRVIDKYYEFLRMFPSFRTLARATTADVLRAWQGLGYNRRALMLHRCAQTVIQNYNGKLPQEYEALRRLPGIGPYTAGAVLAFAFNIAHPVIETNIRRVYLHHFFPKRRNVDDRELLPVVERTLDRKNPRQWYAALMDYGARLTTETKNPNTRSRHYNKQPAFQGSVRQLRGKVVRLIVKHETLTVGQLQKELSDARMPAVLAALEREGFVVRTRSRLKCA